MAVAAFAAGLASCGSSKKVVVPPSGVPEITLDQFTGKQDDGCVSLSGDASSVVNQAKKWLGTRYRYGGTSRAGIDCSALIMNVYLDGCNIKLPRTAASQHQYSARVSRKDLRPGDLVFFTSRRKGSGVAHVGLYIGNDRIIHASTSRGVIESRLSEKYYVDHFHSAGRILKSGKYRVEPVDEVQAITPEILRADSIAEVQRVALDLMLDAAIDSIYTSDPF